MKLLKTVVLLCVFGGLAFSQISVVNSAHNLSSSGPAAQASNDQDRVCVFCHAPHNGGITLLWNRTNPAGSSFTPTTLTESSLRCMSCHDGVTAVNALANGVTADFTDAIADASVIGAGNVLVGSGLLGIDLSINDHPVGMDYPADDTDYFHNASLVDPIVQLVGAGKQIECISCHNAHDMQHGSFLAMNNAGSALCLECHDR